MDRIGQADATGGPFKKYDAELLFQPPDPHTELRLGNCEPLGRAAEVQFFGKDCKGTKVLQMHMIGYP